MGTAKDQTDRAAAPPDPGPVEVPGSGAASGGWVRSIEARFRDRPDTEHQQGLIRVAIATGMALYLVIIGLTGSADPTTFGYVQIAIAMEMVVSVAVLVAIALSPGVSHPRRVIGMLADYGTSGVVMWLQGAVASPLYLVYLWVTIANGLRFGTRYLMLSMALASIGFALVFRYTPYWQQNSLLAWTLLSALIAIPAYQRRLIVDLIRAKDEAFRANRAKSWFLASMSHELRTPLNGIVGMVDLLATTRMTPEQRQYAETIEASSRTLLSLVEDVLDISAIEAGKLRIVARDFSPGDLLHNVETMLRPTALGKDIAYETIVGPGVPRMVNGDADHLRQILVNLTHNAIKFTDRGSVAVAVALVSEEPAQVLLRFSIRDTGIGIPDHAQARIFQAFEQANAGRDRRFGGTGLGTTIAKTLTERLRGTIGFSSVVNQGSTFWIEVPLQRSTAAATSAEEARLVPSNVVTFADRLSRHRSKAGRLNILVADDQEANRVMLCRVLEKAGHVAVSVESGTEALDRLASGGIDLAIVDLHMPIVTGVDVMLQSRALEAGSRQTPFIVLSADATQEAVDSSREAGAMGFLTKPLVTGKLLDLIERISAGGPPTALTVEAGAPLDESVIDLSVLRELCETSQDLAFVRDFAQHCLQDARRCVAATLEAGARGQWQQVREHCHALKGVAGNTGAARLAHRASELMLLAPADLPLAWSQRATDLQVELEAADRALPDAVASLAMPSLH